MTELSHDSVSLVPVVRIRLSLHPVLPSHDVFAFGLSRIELSLSMLELFEVHSLNAFTDESHILGVRKSEGARDEFLHHGFLSREPLLPDVRQALLYQIFK